MSAVHAVPVASVPPPGLTQTPPWQVALPSHGVAPAQQAPPSAPQVPAAQPVAPQTWPREHVPHAAPPVPQRVASCAEIARQTPCSQQPSQVAAEHVTDWSPAPQETEATAVTRRRRTRRAGPTWARKERA